MNDAPNLWWQTLEVDTGKTQRKERKKKERRKEKRKITLSFDTLLSYLENTFFTEISGRGKVF